MPEGTTNFGGAPEDVIHLLEVELRLAGREIHVRGPVYRHILVGAQHLAGPAIQHIEEAVLRRLHQHLAHGAVDLEVGEHDLLRGREIPAVARGLLVVPGQLAGVRVDGQQRAQEQVVATLRAALVPVEQRGVAGAEVQQVQLRVVHHRAPGRAAAANVPAAVRIPGGQCDVLQFLVFLRSQLRIARHDEEPPFECAGPDVVCGDIAARVVIRAGIADHHHVAGHFRRAGGGVPPVVVDDGVDFPDLPAGGGIEPEHAAIQRGDIDHAFPDGEAAIHFVAARPAVHLAIAAGVELPDLPARVGAQCIHAAGGAGGEQHAIHHDGHGFHAARGAGVVTPREAQARGIGLVDGGQWRMMRVPDVTARSQPLAWLVRDVQQPLPVDVAEARRAGGCLPRLRRALTGAALGVLRTGQRHQRSQDGGCTQHTMDGRHHSPFEIAGASCSAQRARPGGGGGAVLLMVSRARCRM